MTSITRPLINELKDLYADKDFLFTSTGSNELFDTIRADIIKRLRDASGLPVEVQEDSSQTQWNQEDSFTWFKEKGAAIYADDSQLVEDNMDWFEDIREHFNNNTMTEALAKEMKTFMTSLVPTELDDTSTGLGNVQKATPVQQKPMMKPSGKPVTEPVCIETMLDEVQADKPTQVDTDKVLATIDQMIEDKPSVSSFPLGALKQKLGIEISDEDLTGIIKGQVCKHLPNTKYTVVIGRVMRKEITPIAA